MKEILKPRQEKLGKRELPLWVITKVHGDSKSTWGCLKRGLGIYDQAWQLFQISFPFVKLMHFLLRGSFSVLHNHCPMFWASAALPRLRLRSRLGHNPTKRIFAKGRNSITELQQSFPSQNKTNCEGTMNRGFLISELQGKREKGFDQWSVTSNET